MIKHRNNSLKTNNKKYIYHKYQKYTLSLFKIDSGIYHASCDPIQTKHINIPINNKQSLTWEIIPPIIYPCVLSRVLFLGEQFCFMEQYLNQLSSITQRYLPPVNRLPVAIFSLLVIAALIFGWQAGLENYITAESGIGYFLGIMGGSMMLLMLLYSLRKRIRFMRSWFATKYWFRMHMMFGVLGPTLILYHSAFKLGSTNSNVALICMLVVAASGLVGRYIYRQIHFGLYGSKTTAEQLKTDFLSSRSEIDALLKIHPDFEQKLFVIDTSDLDKKQNIISQFLKLFTFSITGRIAYYSAVRNLSKTIRLIQKNENWDKRTTKKFFREAKNTLAVYYATIRKIVGFQFYERMFSLWHVLHIPLFIMMIISGITHVFAVHLY